MKKRASNLNESRPLSNEDDGANSPSEPPAVEMARRQFLVKVHGYSAPPTTWELAQLAAMAGEKVPKDHSRLSMDEAARRVALARHIWDAAASMKKEMHDRLERTGKSFDAIFPLYGPLKIGSHFLPRIVRWDEVDGRVPFKRYLEQVVGLAREEDRMRWWRAFLTAKIRRQMHDEKRRDHEEDEPRTAPGRREPDDLPAVMKVAAETLATQRLEGFDVGFSAGYHLEDFRKWRLGMSAPGRKAKETVSLEDAAKKGLEEERSGKSGKSPPNA